MSLLTKPSDLEGKKTFTGMLYGQPGTWKTTTALSAPNPVLVDLDRGLHRVKPGYRVSSLQVQTYDEVLKLLNSDEIASCDTLVFDTLGKLVDRIGEYVSKRNPKARQADGQMTPKGWGEVKSEFGNLVRLLNSKGKNIIFVAHESEERNGDDTIKRPDCSGSARRDIVKELDWMGYVEMVGTKHMLNFDPTDRYYAKNSLGVDGTFVIPRLTGNEPNNFISKNIVRLTADKLAEEAVLRKEYDALIADIESKVAAVKDIETANAFYAGRGDVPVIWDSTFQMQKLLIARVHAVGLEFSKETKKFVKAAPKSAPAASAHEKAEDASAGKKSGKATAAKGKGKPEAPAKQEEISDNSFSE